MADTCEGRSYRSYFIHNLCGGQMRLRISHTVHDLGEDPDVLSGLAFDLYRFTDTLYTTLGIGEGSLFLCIGTARKDNVCHFCSLCQE